jgi:ribosomal protein S18 acetylase RimI-like enzyme
VPDPQDRSHATHSLRYRYAREVDVPGVVALVESAYRGGESLTGWTSEAELIDGQRTDAGAVAGVIASPAARILLAEEGPDLRACCELRQPGQPGGNAYFGMLAVRPSLQGGGYGRAILAEAERLAREELGASRLEMTVIRQRETLIAWYGRRGYTDTGERRPFPYGDESVGRPRVGDLEFAVLVKTL